MDDSLILSDSKERLHEDEKRISDFLEQELHLKLNGKTSIRPIECGIEFVGYRVWATHRKLRKSSSKKLKRGLRWIQKQYAQGNVTLEEIKPNIMSYYGLLQHFDSHSLTESIMESFVLQRQVPEPGTG